MDEISIILKIEYHINQMHKDIIGIIESYAHIDLNTYEYKCENCNENCDQFNQISCCIYSQFTNSNITTYSVECDFYRIIQKLKFQYICSECYNQISRYNIFFYFRNILEIESFELLFKEILESEKKKLLQKCQLPNVFIMQFNSQNCYKTIFTKYQFDNNSIISHNLFYENNQSLSKFFYALSQKQRTHFEIFKVEEFLKITI